MKRWHNLAEVVVHGQELASERGIRPQLAGDLAAAAIAMRMTDEDGDRLLAAQLQSVSVLFVPAVSGHAAGRLRQVNS